MRKELDVVTSTKYRGQRISRKDIEQDDVSQSESLSDDDSENDAGEHSVQDINELPNPHESSSSDEGGVDGEQNDRADEIVHQETIRVLNDTRNQELLKGKAIARQMVGRPRRALQSIY